MSEFRNWLLVVVAVGLAIFAVQNSSPSLQLMFLGMQSVALPLSVWMLLALAAGVLTSYLISGLFGLSNYLFERELSARRRSYPPQEPSSPSPRQQVNTTLQSNWSAPTVAGAASYAATTGGEYEVRSIPRSPAPEAKVAAENPKAIAENADDYEEFPEDDEEFDEEWEEEEQPVDRVVDSQNIKKDPTTFESEREPKIINRSGTMYSIGYRDPSETGVGQTESVYDADYRLVNPPVQEPSPEIKVDSLASDISDTPVKEPAPKPEPEEDDWGKKKKKNEDW